MCVCVCVCVCVSVCVCADAEKIRPSILRCEGKKQFGPKLNELDCLESTLLEAP